MTTAVMQEVPKAREKPTLNFTPEVMQSLLLKASQRKPGLTILWSKLGGVSVATREAVLKQASQHDIDVQVLPTGLVQIRLGHMSFRIANHEQLLSLNAWCLEAQTAIAEKRSSYGNPKCHFDKLI